MLIDVNEKVTKEAYELGMGLNKFVLDMRAALADGWQPGSDLPAVLTATINDLVPAVQGVDQLAAEEKENTEAFFTAFMLPVKSLVFKLLAKA